MTYFEQKIKEWARLMQRHPFDEVLSYLEELKKKAPVDHSLFIFLATSDEILIEIYQQRVKLAVIAAKPAEAEVLPEDRGRLILLLAKCVKLTLKEANKLLEREFGSGFQLQENYSYGNGTISWSQLVQRANEIKRGIYNICYFQVQEPINEIMAYYKIFQVNDQDKILQILNLAQDIRDELGSAPQISTRVDYAKPIIVKTKKLFQLTGRLKMDIDALDDEPDFMEIQQYAFTISFVAMARAAAITQKKPVDDWNFAKSFLTKILGQTKFLSLQSTDELKRMHKTLTLKQKG